MGFQPELFKCINCGEELEPVENGFSLAGGVVCPEYAALDPRAYARSRLTSSEVPATNQARLRQHSRLARLRLSEDLHGEIDRALRIYVGFVLERDRDRWRPALTASNVPD